MSSLSTIVKAACGDMDCLCHRVMEDAETGDLVIVGGGLPFKEQIDLRLERGECAIRISKSLVVQSVRKLMEGT